MLKGGTRIYPWCPYPPVAKDKLENLRPRSHSHMRSKLKRLKPRRAQQLAARETTMASRRLGQGMSEGAVRSPRLRKRSLRPLSEYPDPASIAGGGGF